MNDRNVLRIVFLLSLMTIVALPVLATFEAPTNETELKSFVESAVAHVKEVGKEQAIKDFMNLNSSWVRGDVYIFADDFNGTTLVLPYSSKEVGTNRLDTKNDQGVYVNREIHAIARNGSGFYEYRWKNPISNQTEQKISYVTKVDDTWLLGAGIYKH